MTSKASRTSDPHPDDPETEPSQPAPDGPSRGPAVIDFGRQVSVLLVFLAASAVVAWVGANWTASSVGSWYAGLEKPPWTPPNFLFGPVWSVLYVAMAVAAWMVWRRGGWRENPWALSLYAIQLLLNLFWSGLFFGMRSPLWGLVDITFLWLAILATLVLFFRRSRLAGWLMVPYLLWVSYAAALNFAIWRLNPGV